MGRESQKIVSVILAAGKGTRMQSPQTHKVCFSIEGRPVIARAIESYERCGVENNYIVVGQMAEQVMQAASSAPGNLFFCYQTEQKGTGNAAKTAARLLQAMDYNDAVLVVAGDKVIEDEILTKLINTFYETECDLAFVVGGASDFPSSGRVVCGEDGKVFGIVEVFDIARMQLLSSLERITRERLVTAQEAESLALSYLKQEKKAALALGPLWDAIKNGSSITRDMITANFDDSDLSLHVNGVNLPPKLLTNVRYANLSVYLFKARALYDALARLTSDNAQQEEYLTDTVGILISGGCNLQAVPVEYPEQVMAFNTPEELKAIEDYVTSKKGVTVRESARSVRRAGRWLQIMDSTDAAWVRCLSSIYGEGHPAVETTRRQLVTMLKNYIRQFGDEDVIITRAPGRVNIMGRHVDHQGGHGNMIAIDRDVHMVIGARKDRQVHLHNLEPHHFPDRCFDIDELMSDYDGGDWQDFVNSEAVRARASAAVGDWSQYVKAAVVRFQVKHSHRSLKGMNILASGSIPIAAGLSSSSAVVVAVTEGIVKLNDLDVSPQQFVALCGEGEWYVGTRGGAGDHAAMKFAKKGHVVQVGFFPFGVTDTVQFPANHVFVVCDSYQKARKTAGAKDIFNHRVACYHIGRELLKKKYPKYASAIEHLRDLNVRTLGVDYRELLEMLKSLPTVMSRDEIKAALPPDLSDKYLSSHSDSLDSYPVRSVVLYGLGECERSRMCPDLLRKGAAPEFGDWMNISHNGDRVVTWDRKGNSWPFTVDYSDKVMDELISRSGSLSGDAVLPVQPGGYSCSIPQIDQMIDIALSVKGVQGAQILGAGLGGCILVLVHKDSYDDLEKAMIRRYYDNLELDPGMFACHPVAGSGLISF